MNRRLTLSLISSVALLAAMFVSCSDRKAGGIETKEITVEEVELTPEAIIGRALSIERAGDYLLVLDNKIDSMTHLIDVGRNRYAGQFVAKGAGPGEFGNIVMISTLPGRDNAFSVLRTDLHDLFLAEVKGTDSLYLAYTRIANLPDAWYVRGLANGDYVISNGYVDWPEMFTVLDSEGNVKGRYGDRMPDERAAGASPQAITAAYQFEPVVSPDGTKVAGIPSGDEAAAFFRLEGDTLRTVNRFCRHTMKNIFENGNYLGVNGKDGGEVCFISGVADNEHVYILYSGQEFSKADWTGNMLWVYDWDGNKTGEYTLSKRIRSMTAPDESGRIYAISEDGTDPILVTFSVK